MQLAKVSYAENTKLNEELQYLTKANPGVDDIWEQSSASRYERLKVKKNLFFVSIQKEAKDFINAPANNEFAWNMAAKCVRTV